MKNVNRRRFLETSLVGAAFVTAGQSALANKLDLRLSEGKILELEQSNSAEVVKISFQESTAPGKTLRDKFDFTEEHGVVGFEPGGKGLLQRVLQLQEELKGRNIAVTTICVGFDGFVLSTDESISKQFHDTMSEIIIAAGQLGSTGVIICSCFQSPSTFNASYDEFA